MILEPIAHMSCPFHGKFGVPRQSGRVSEAVGRIVFLPEYRNAQALRGLDGYTHLWLLWHFSLDSHEGWSPTVRPPRLGGNIRMGVFATRSPNRPNPIGLSCVKIERIVTSSAQGPYIEVSGIDLTDGTPIFDIKPYLPASDCIVQAKGGFSDAVNGHRLEVCDPHGYLSSLSQTDSDVIRGLLAEDPRPAYQQDPSRVYRFEFDRFRISFSVRGLALTVCGIDLLGQEEQKNKK